jgi:hypothetical protein
VYSNFSTPAGPGEALLLREIFSLLKQLSARGSLATDNAIADARAAVRERANILRDPAQRTLREIGIAPLVKTVAELTGCDRSTVASVGAAVLLPSRSRVVVDVFRLHVASTPTAKAPRRPNVEVLWHQPIAIARRA